MSEILESIDDIYSSKKKIDKNNFKTSISTENKNMKKVKKPTQGTFGETIEVEEEIADSFDNAEPFEIEEITKVNNTSDQTQKVNEDILLLTNEIVDKPFTQITNKESFESKQILKLNDQVSKLKAENVQLENNLGEIAKKITDDGGDKEFHAKLDVIYKQQTVIKEYEKQISELRALVQKLEKNVELPPSWLTGDLKKDQSNEVTISASNNYDEEIETKTKIIHEQQGILTDYQHQIFKLREENKALQQNLEMQSNSSEITEQQIQQENNKAEMEEMSKKIKFYQDDNLRLSNEVVNLSSKLENTKIQLNQFESNKSRLMSQLENLNNIILENNVIGSSFKKNIPSTENKQEISKKITDQQEVIEKVFKKTTSLEKPKKPEEMDILTKKIFGKE